MFVHRLLLPVALAAASLSAPSAWAQDHSVIAPALEGQLQCYEPDTTRKVCRALAGYELQPDGTIANPFEVLVAPDPVIIARGTTPVTIRDNAICGPMTRAELDRFTFTANGRPVPEDMAVNFRDAIANSPGALANEVCTTYTPVEGGQIRADAVVDGVAQPDMTQHVIWVRPDEGYTVAP